MSHRVGISFGLTRLAFPSGGQLLKVQLPKLPTGDSFNKAQLHLIKLISIRNATLIES